MAMSNDAWIKVGRASCNGLIWIRGGRPGWRACRGMGSCDYYQGFSLNVFGNAFAWEIRWQ